LSCHDHSKSKAEMVCGLQIIDVFAILGRSSIYIYIYIYYVYIYVYPQEVNCWHDAILPEGRDRKTTMNAGRML